MEEGAPYVTYAQGEVKGVLVGASLETPMDLVELGLLTLQRTVAVESVTDEL